MNQEQILELARRHGDHSVADVDWSFYEPDLIAFAQSVLEEELIAAAEAIVMTQDIYGGIPTKMVDHLRDLIERMKNDDR